MPSGLLGNPSSTAASGGPPSPKGRLPSGLLVCGGSEPPPYCKLVAFCGTVKTVPYNSTEKRAATQGRPYIYIITFSRKLKNALQKNLPQGEFYSK